jgi:polyisoprenoid-binding protein YceI
VAARLWRCTLRRDSLRFGVVCLVAFALLPSLSRAKGPVFVVEQEGSTVRFSVKASVAIEGEFDKWEAALTFPSTDVTTGVLDIKIHADSVNTGSGMKDDKLRSKDFFNAKDEPYITFHSDKVVQYAATARLSLAKAFGLPVDAVVMFIPFREKCGDPEPNCREVLLTSFP